MSYADLALHRYHASMALAALAFQHHTSGKPHFDRMIALSEIAFDMKKHASDDDVNNTIDRIMVFARTPSLISSVLLPQAEKALTDSSLYVDSQALALLISMAHERKQVFTRLVQRAEVFKKSFSHLPPRHEHTPQPAARTEADTGSASLHLHPYAD